MKRPLVGISTLLLRDISHASRIVPVSDRIFSNIEFVSAVRNAGGIPVLIPITTDEELISEYVDTCDAFVMHGGPDANPVLFGDEPSELGRPGNIESDMCDAGIICGAMENDKPILGVCRGMQMMNLVMGGSLFQDISLVQEKVDREHPDENTKIMVHRQPNPENEPYHYVQTAPGTLAAELFGDKIAVNSHHHQCVKDPAPGAVVSAWASDGVVEAVEFPGKRFALGLQWHPEMMVTLNSGVYKEQQKRVFDALIAAARQ